jgi:hypothetical protein
MINEGRRSTYRLRNRVRTLTALDERTGNVNPVVKLLGSELELNETLGRRQLPDDLELLLASQRPHRGREVIGILFAHETEEI